MIPNSKFITDNARLKKIDLNFEIQNQNLQFKMKIRNLK